MIIVLYCQTCNAYRMPDPRYTARKCSRCGGAL